MWVSEVELQTLLGEKDAGIFLYCYGGQRVYIPTSVPENHPLARRMGMCIAEKLSLEYPSTVLELPSSQIRETAKKKIFELLDKRELSYGKIAYQAHAGVRYVEMCAREWKKSQQDPTAASNFP